MDQTNTKTLHFPRILCLHGGGSNARIFKAQCRVLERVLQSKFRLCYAEGPFSSHPGPDVTLVYKEFGDFRTWIRWQSEDSLKLDDGSVLAPIVASLTAAMANDTAQGATGEWVGLLGFSQGAKICASILLAQSTSTLRFHDNGEIDFRFAVLLAGRGPLLSIKLKNRVSSRDFETYSIQPLIRIQTLHVHGMRDSGLKYHQQLLKESFDPAYTRLVEWDGDHRVPIKTNDVATVTSAIFAMALDVGISLD
jgi:predicted esterase